MGQLTPEEVKREFVEAAERVNWLAGVRKRVDEAYTSEGEPEVAARLDAEKLLYYVDELRDLGIRLRRENEGLREYLREKNEIIKAFAGTTEMTPEDVAYIVEAWQADGLGGRALPEGEDG